MHFSGKITNSLFSYLNSQGVELGEVYELTDLPQEFLKDPTCWLPAKKVEEILQYLEQTSLLQKALEQPIAGAGHAAKELKAWGVLDSVLRMIEKPDDIFMQPQRFLSYFISPAPPIANIQRGLHTVSFDLPISYEESPYVAAYLCSAIESVPLFMGLPMAEAHWRQNRVTVSWDQAQTIFGESDLSRRQMAPEVMHNLINTLEKTELALLEKTRELEKIKSENALAAQSQPQVAHEFSQLNKRVLAFQNQVMKLQDYFTRSQQLITLLVAQDRMTPQVREAMKRVNWTQVQSAFPEVTGELLKLLSHPSFEENQDATNIQDPRTGDSRQSWLPHN